jgi:hypothetical protein
LKLELRVRLRGTKPTTATIGLKKRLTSFQASLKLGQLVTVGIVGPLLARRGANIKTPSNCSDLVKVSKGSMFRGVTAHSLVDCWKSARSRFISA